MWASACRAGAAAGASRRLMSMQSQSQSARLGLGNAPAWSFVKKLYKGTVLEALGRGLPHEDRVFLAHRWGFHAVGEQVDSLSRADEDGVHPIYGSILSNLGYKKVYMTSLQRLVRAPVWERQRILRPERAMEIASCLAKDKNQQPNLPGVITFYRDRAKQLKTGIVDGQHRVGALMILSEQGLWDASASNVLVDVFDTDGEEHVARLFRDINLAEPVRLVDMPEAADGLSAQRREALNEAVELLEMHHRTMFKPSSRCRVPHVNKDVLRDDIFQSELMQRHGLQTGAQLLAWLKKTNSRLAQTNDQEWAAMRKGKAAAAALAKARACNFFLGMDKSWLYTD